jgi:MraZ protein
MGRLLVSKDLQEYAALGKDMVLNCKLNIIEVWDKDAYEKAVNINNDDFSEMTEEILGNFYNNGIDLP